MVIQYLGEECFRLQSGETSILVDPTSNRLKADLVLRTMAPLDASPVAGEITLPGEYEVKGIEVRGFQVESGTKETVKTVYMVLWEEMKFVILGHLAHDLDAETAEALGDPDVLFLPVEGKDVLEASAAAKLAKQLSSAIVIPSFAKSPAEFLKAMGEKSEPQEKLVFKKKDIADKKSEVVVLKTE